MLSFYRCGCEEVSVWGWGALWVRAVVLAQRCLASTRTSAGAQCLADNARKAWPMWFVGAGTAENLGHKKFKPHADSWWCAGISWWDISGVLCELPLWKTFTQQHWWAPLNPEEDEKIWTLMVPWRLGLHPLAWGPCPYPEPGKGRLPARGRLCHHAVG